jgi:hypothetical protein
MANTQGVSGCLNNCSMRLTLPAEAQVTRIYCAHHLLVCLTDDQHTPCILTSTQQAHLCPVLSCRSPWGGGGGWGAHSPCQGWWCWPSRPSCLVIMGQVGDLLTGLAPTMCPQVLEGTLRPGLLAGPAIYLSSYGCCSGTCCQQP